jgi:hypothetical protein
LPIYREALGQSFYEYKGTQSNWTSVYMPVAPLTPELRARLAQNPNVVQDIPAASIRVIVHSAKVHGQADLPKVFAQPRIQGTIVNSIRSLDSQTQRLLQSSYPGANFEKCLILQEGRTPKGTGFTVVMALVGTLITVVCALLLLVRFLFLHEV